MATTATRTVQTMVTQALRKAGIVGVDEDPPAEDAANAFAELDAMLKGWQNKGYNLWTKTSGSLTLTTNANHTLSPVRPLKILSARYREAASSSEIPMVEMTRAEYDELPLKTTTGTPTQFHYDRQREAAVFYVWPVLSSVTAQTVQYTYDRELEDITALTETLDMPGEWWDCVMYNLAARLLETYNLQKPIVQQRAEMLLFDAGAFDREGSVMFGRE